MKREEEGEAGKKETAHDYKGLEGQRQEHDFTVGISTYSQLHHQQQKP